jgi:hypothetical protein
MKQGKAQEKKKPRGNNNNNNGGEDDMEAFEDREKVARTPTKEYASSEEDYEEFSDEETM